MESGTTLSAPSICYRALQAYLSLPYGLKAGPNPALCDRRSTDIPALQETPLVLGAGPGLLPPLLSPVSTATAKAGAHSASHTTTLFA